MKVGSNRSFDIVCEIEPAVRPNLDGVREQVKVMSGLVSSFLVPDNHLGRATVSSIAVASEVARLGVRTIACINARDRNLLGFQRDLLTAAAYEIHDLVFVYGDRPVIGRRAGELTVRQMLDEANSFRDRLGSSGNELRFGVSAPLGTLPGWKQDAEFLLTQVSFSSQDVIEWRTAVRFEGPVYAGVMVVASPEMGHRLAKDVPQLAIPEHVMDRVERDRNGGVDLAIDLIDELRASGAVEGIHLVPVRRYRDVARKLAAAAPVNLPETPGVGN